MIDWGEAVWASPNWCVAELDRDARVTRRNDSWPSEAAPVGGYIAGVVAGGQQPALLTALSRAHDAGWTRATFSCFPDSSGATADCLVWMRRFGDRLWVAIEAATDAEAHLSERLLAMNEELVSTQRVLAREQQRLEELVEELRSSRLYIRKLEGILPICSRCQRVREDDDRSWVDMSDYVKAHSDVRLSHGYCPDCAEREMQALDEVPPAREAS